MFRRTLCIITALLALGGCKNAKELLGSAAGGGSTSADITPGGKVDAELDSLVLRQGDAVQFRRDLPFPPRLESRMKISLDYRNVRVVEVSALGRSTDVLNQKMETELWCSKNPGTFEIRLEKSGRRVVPEDEETPAPADNSRASQLEGQSLRFALSEGGWRNRQEAGAVDFKNAVWADSMEEMVPQLMVETGAHPRPQWFSSSREWRAGDQVTLTGNALKILDPYDVSGHMELKFEGVEAVGGHPCGVFSVKGDMRIHDQLQPDGSCHDCEMAVTSGKIWVSLIYPVLLREEYETVQTLSQRQGNRGGPEIRLQGAVGLKKSRNWMPAK